jgi:DNA-directed RNA polymerase subunit L
MKGVYKLGKGINNAIYTAVKICLYEEINENNYNFAFKSLCCLTSKEIIEKTIKIIIRKLENIEILIGQKYNDSTLSKLDNIRVVLDNETHTMGNLITTILQQKVQAGYKMNDFVEHVDENIVYINIYAKNPIKILYDVINELKRMYNDIGRNIMEKIK